MNLELQEQVRDLTKDQVFASSNPTELLQWHEGLTDLADEIRSRIEAYTHAGTADEDWRRRAAGKVSCTMRALRWVERRCAELNIETPLPWDHQHRRTIQRLQSQVHDENKGETRRILAWLKAEYPDDEVIASAIAGIGAGYHRRREAA